MRTRLAIIIAVGSLVVAGCGDEHQEENIDEEGCEHLTQGPFVNVTAGAALDVTAPAIAADHKAYNVALADGKVGYVSFASSKEGDIVLFLDRDVAVAVSDAKSTAVAIEESSKSSAACKDIAGRHVVPLGVGTYYIAFGPVTGATAFQVVVEPLEHED